MMVKNIALPREFPHAYITKTEVTAVLGQNLIRL